MKKNFSHSEDDRLKNVLLTDKSLNPSRTTTVLRAELKNLLSNFMDISSITIGVKDLDVGAELNIKVSVKKFYSLITSI